MALFYKDLVFMSTLVIFSKIQYTFFVKFLYPALFCLFSLFLFSCKIDKNFYQGEDELVFKTSLFKNERYSMGRRNRSRYFIHHRG